MTSDLIVVANTEDAAEWLPGTRVVSDAWPAQGSLVGIHAALTHAREPVLVVAWDMPFVTRAVCDLLQERSARSAYATVPGSATGLEPFCAVYTPACLPFIEARLAADDLRVSGLFGALPSYERVDVSALGDPTHLFFNVNSAEDLAMAERIAASG